MKVLLLLIKGPKRWNTNFSIQFYKLIFQISCMAQFIPNNLSVKGWTSILIQSLYKPQITPAAKNAFIVRCFHELHTQLRHHTRTKLLLPLMHLLILLNLALKLLILQLKLLELLLYFLYMQLNCLLLIFQLRFKISLNFVFDVLHFIFMLLLQRIYLLHQRIRLQFRIFTFLSRQFEVFF